MGLNRNKILILLSSIIAVTSLSSCNSSFGFPTNSDDPEIIKLIEFSNNFSLEKCVDTYLWADLDYVLTDTYNNVEQGKHTVDFTFSREVDANWYSNHVEYLEGTLKSHDFPNLYKFERNITPLGEGRYQYITLHDGVRVEDQSIDNISQADAYRKLYGFYAVEGGINDGAVNGGGMYFGDEILINANQYWKNMRVDLDKNILIFKYENLRYDKNSTASLEYAVNEYGMLVYYYQTLTQKINNDTRIINCVMNINYTK